MKLEYLECGRLLAPHGVRGAMKMESYCDTPAAAAALPILYFRDKAGQYTGRRVLHAQEYKGGVLLSLEGLASPEDAALLRGVTVYARREDLDPRGERVFLAETCGLPVYHAESGRLLGQVEAVDTTRRTTLYVIKTEAGEVLLPDVPEFIKEIRIDGGLFVTPIPGFFDEV